MDLPHKAAPSPARARQTSNGIRVLQNPLAMFARTMIAIPTRYSSFGPLSHAIMSFVDHHERMSTHQRSPKRPEATKNIPTVNLLHQHTNSSPFIDLPITRCNPAQFPRIRCPQMSPNLGNGYDDHPKLALSDKLCSTACRHEEVFEGFASTV